MPPIPLIFFKADDGTVPMLEWLDEQSPKVRQKSLLRLQRLAMLGHELRRPEADLLRNGIHELRIVFQGVHHRILYFFHGRIAVVATHAFTKERVIPPVEIDRAIAHRRAFEANPAAHSFQPGI